MQQNYLHSPQCECSCTLVRINTILNFDYIYCIDYGQAVQMLTLIQKPACNSIKYREHWRVKPYLTRSDYAN